MASYLKIGMSLMNNKLVTQSWGQLRSVDSLELTNHNTSHVGVNMVHLHPNENGIQQHHSSEESIKDST